MVAAWTNVVATLLLSGFIWTIQVLHYPLFAQVGTEGFAAYEAAHSQRVTWLIVVPWAAQGIATAVLLLAPPDGVPAWLPWLGAVFALATVVVTVAVSVPQHGVLADGFDATAHRVLTQTNWWRTAAWTGHAVVSLLVLDRALRAR